jgi:hypothetical protein
MPVKRPRLSVAIFWGIVALTLLTWSKSLAMEMPSGQHVFSYGPAALPELQDNPALSKPVGVGGAAGDGGNLDLRVRLGAFPSAVDVYLCFWMPSVDPVNCYLLLPDGRFQALSGGLQPWIGGTSGPVERTVFAGIPIALLPPGEYTIFLAVAPSGSLESFYLWMTRFTASTHAIRSVGGIITDLSTGAPIPGAEITMRVDLDGDGLYRTPDVLVDYAQETLVSRSDARGAFLIPGVPVGDAVGNAYPVLVSATAPGYSDARRTMRLPGGNSLHLEIIPSETAVDDDLTDGFQVALRAAERSARGLVVGSKAAPLENEGSLVTVTIAPENIPASTTALSAQVAYGDPNTVQTAVPGQFRAEMDGEDGFLLESAVYADIVLSDQTGRRILTKQDLSARQVNDAEDASTRVATIKILVPTASYRALYDMIPETDDRIEIAMWWFDEAEQVWRLDDQYGWLEDNAGTLIDRDSFSAIRLGDFEGSVYAVSAVNHFTPWNCDMPRGGTNIAGTITGSDGGPPSPVDFEIIYGEGNGGTSGTTDPSGNVSAPAPSSGSTSNSWDEAFKGVSVAKFAHRLSMHSDSILNADTDSRRRFLTTLRDIERAGVLPKVSSSAFGQDIPDSLQWLIDNAGNSDTLYQGVFNNYLNQLKTHRGGLVGDVGNIALGNARDDLVSRIPVFGKVWGWVTHPAVSIGAGEIEANRIDSLVQQLMLQVRAAYARAAESSFPVGVPAGSLSGTDLEEMDPRSSSMSALQQEIYDRLTRLLNQEAYTDWAYWSDDPVRSASDWQGAPAPGVNRGGRSRAAIRIPLGGGQYLYPGISDTGVDWQDIGIPILQSPPGGSPDRPVRWIGTVQVDLFRMVSGRLVYDTESPAAETKIVSRSGREALSDMDGRFAIEITKLDDVLFVPEAVDYEIPGGNDDIDLGDVVIPTGAPVLGDIVITPPAPVAGDDPVEFTVPAEDAEGDPLEYRWTLGCWDLSAYRLVAEAASPVFSISGIMPGRYRADVTVTDGTHETAKEKYFTIDTAAPEITGFDVPGVVSRGARVAVRIAARDPQGLPLTYTWIGIDADSGGFSDASAPNTTWYAPTSSDVASVRFKAVASNGVRDAQQTFEVLITDENMLPEFAYLAADKNAGECPLEVSFECVADDPDGSIDTYLWDFDGDGAYDEETPVCQATWVFFTEGAYFPRVTALDDRGGESSADAPTVSVSCDAGDEELTLVCSPASGPAGTAITFRGYGWPPGSQVEISFDNEIVVPLTTADAVGSFTAAWTVPAGTSHGAKDVVANVIGSVTVWTAAEFVVE